MLLFLVSLPSAKTDRTITILQPSPAEVIVSYHKEKSTRNINQFTLHRKIGSHTIRCSSIWGCVREDKKDGAKALLKVRRFKLLSLVIVKHCQQQTPLQSLEPAACESHYIRGKITRACDTFDWQPITRQFPATRHKTPGNCDTLSSGKYVCQTHIYASVYTHT